MEQCYRHLPRVHQHPTCRAQHAPASYAPRATGMLLAPATYTPATFVARGHCHTRMQPATNHSNTSILRATHRTLPAVKHAHTYTSPDPAPTPPQKGRARGTARQFENYRGVDHASTSSYPTTKEPHTTERRTRYVFSLPAPWPQPNLGDALLAQLPFFAAF